MLRVVILKLRRQLPMLTVKVPDHSKRIWFFEWDLLNCSIQKELLFVCPSTFTGFS
jgi:hypothetical protein